MTARHYAAREQAAAFPIDDRTDEELIAEAEERARRAGLIPIDDCPTVRVHELRDYSVRIVYLRCRPSKEKGPEHPPRTPIGHLPAGRLTERRSSKYAGAL